MSKRFRVRIDGDRCKACALCIKACVQRLIGLSRSANASGGHFAEIRDEEACQGCRNCAMMCPEAAIEIDRIDDPADEAASPPGEGT